MLWCIVSIEVLLSKSVAKSSVAGHVERGRFNVNGLLDKEFRTDVPNWSLNMNAATIALPGV